MSNIHEEKEELIEMFGIHFETHHRLSPLSARILSLLIVENCKPGLTFDDLVLKLGASKSSVSTNLTLLVEMGKLEYYTVSGDRKKYYRPSSFGDRMRTYLRIVLDEKKMVNKMVEYRKKTATTDTESLNLEMLKVYQEHVNDFEGFLNNTIKKLDKIENK